jgi:hypothetical protein
MKNSTVIVGASTLVLLGAGVYLYLKGKKTTTPISSSPTSTNTTSSSSSTVNSSLGSPTTSSPSAEEQKNYLKAKDLARILWLHKAKIYDNEYKLLLSKEDIRYIEAILPLPSQRDKFQSDVAQKINSLGYKVLSNFDIEKM